MEARELRIGNWVYNSAFVNIKIGSVPGGQMPNWSPIPLTPEILEKAGFSQAYITDPQEYNPSQKYWFNEFGVYNIKGHSSIIWFSDSINVELKTVHQLQNLYFALTGTELQIEL